MKPTHLLLGEILRPHGIRGELRMRVLTDYPERIMELDSVFLGASIDAKRLTEFKIQKMRMHQGYALLTLEGVNDRNTAETLRGLVVMVDINEAVPLEDDEVYLYQLIGMRVITTEDTLVGHVSDVLETGANDVYVITTPEDHEILIPAIESTILEIDTESNTIRVEIPEGLIPS